MYLTPNPVQQLPTFRLKLPIARESQGSYYTLQPLPGCPRMPPSLQLRQYQREAIASWFTNNG
ncbi:MAG: helicase, partial [Nostoc sp.]